MAPYYKADAAQAPVLNEPELRAASSEGEPMATPSTPHLNGSGNMAVHDEQDHAFIAFLRGFGPVILAAAFGVIASLAAAGFIMKPATTAYVDDLKTSVSTFIENHNKLDFVKDNFLKQHLQEINFSLRELLDRSRQTEIQQARTDAKVEDVMRLLTNAPAPSPSQSPLKALPKKPATIREP